MTELSQLNHKEGTREKINLVFCLHGQEPTKKLHFLLGCEVELNINVSPSSLNISSLKNRSRVAVRHSGITATKNKLKHENH